MWYIYLFVTGGLLFYSRTKIYSGFSFVYNLFKYKNDNRYEAVKFGRHLLGVPYIYRHKQYIALLPIKSHKNITVLNVFTNKISSVNTSGGGTNSSLGSTDISEIEITDEFSKYLGHNYDFSGCKVFPKMFGYSQLSFKVMNEDGNIEKYTFKDTEPIVFSKKSD